MNVILPRWAAYLVRLLAPRLFADDLVADLAEGWDRQRRAGRPAHRWLVRELVRTPWPGLWMQARRMRGRRGLPVWGAAAVFADLRLAVRSLARAPSFVLVTVTTLTVSIAAVTLAFGLLQGILLRPLPYPEPESLYDVRAVNPSWRESNVAEFRKQWDTAPISGSVVDRLRTDIAGVVAFGGYACVRLDLRAGRDGPEMLDGVFVLPGFFETLRSAPAAGRLPTAREVRDGARVIVLSERLRADGYAAGASAVADTVYLDGVAHEVIGILPATVSAPEQLTHWWAPAPEQLAASWTDSDIFQGVARIARMADAAEVAAAMSERAAEGTPRTDGAGLSGIRLSPLLDTVVSQVRPFVETFFRAVVVLVLICAVNLAGVMLARSSRRSSDLAVLAAIGASRTALVRTLLCEALLVCAAGGVTGVFVASLLADPFLAIVASASPGFPRTENVAVNAPVIAFAAAVTFVVALLCGLLPALSAARRAARAGMHLSRIRGRSGGRTQAALLTVEAALAVVLLTVAGLLVRTALHVSAVDPGFDGRPVAYVSVFPPAERYPAAADVHAVGIELEALLTALPGVQAAGRTSSVPAVGEVWLRLMRSDGQEPDEGSVFAIADVSAGYFQAMGIPLLSGRTFASGDDADAPRVVIVGESLARNLFGAADPLGRTILVAAGTRMSGGRILPDGETPATVIGVVPDVHQTSIVRDPDPVLYRALSQTGERRQRLVLRTDGAPEPTLSSARRAILALDPALLTAGSAVLAHAMRDHLGPLRVRLILVISLASLAVAITAVGIHGVVAGAVSAQVPEIGVRIALGARPLAESARVIGQTVVPVMLGAVLGLAGGFAASRLVASTLLGVGSFDAATYAAVLGILSAAAALSAWLPARHAARVDPVRVLSGE